MALVLGQSRLPSVQVVHSVSQNVTGGGTYTVLTWDTERFDTGAMHEPVTNPTRLTCVTPGLYSVVGHILPTALSAGRCFASIYLNGVENVRGASAPTGAGEFEVSADMALVAGDYIQLAVFQTGAGFTQVFGVNGVLNRTDFSMVRITSLS